MIISKTKAASLVLDPAIVRAIPSFLAIHEAAKQKMAAHSCGNCSGAASTEMESIATSAISFMQSMSSEDKKTFREYLKASDVYIYIKNPKGGVELQLL